MSRIVILEGPDGAGKTTLAGQISKAYGHRYHHEGPPPADKDPYVYYLHRMYELAIECYGPGDAHAHRVVCDRFALGDRVYGPILRGQDRIGEKGWRSLREALDAVGAVRVLCLPPFETCRRAFVEAEQMIKDEETFRRTYEAWASFADDPGQLVYDWTAENGDGQKVLWEIGRRMR